LLPSLDRAFAAMLKVGLTGGLASGKTFVGHALVELGCHLIQADELGHRVLHSSGGGFAPVLRIFGDGILRPDGEIDRRLLAAQVFGDPERLQMLNRIVHPLVYQLEEEWLARIAGTDPHGIAIVEAAILIETGSYKRFDKIILVVVDEQLQIERAMRRDRMTRDEVLARLQRQMPLAAKRKFADFIIDTSGPKSETLDKTRELYESLRRIAK
jgi:dephospho-CoA kinase